MSHFPTRVLVEARLFDDMWSVGNLSFGRPLGFLAIKYLRQ